MKLHVFIIVIIVSFINISSQDITITIDTLKMEHKDHSVTIPYKFKNTTGNDITFLDKKEFISLSRCYYLTTSKYDFYNEKDSSRYIEDFITLKAGEETERSVKFYINWPCRNRPSGNLLASYNSSITNDDNYYYYNSEDSKYEKVYINAWTGTIISKSFYILLKSYE